MNLEEEKLSEDVRMKSSSPNFFSLAVRGISAEEAKEVARHTVTPYRRPRPY
jgi:hypothetical protein